MVILEFVREAFSANQHSVGGFWASDTRKYMAENSNVGPCPSEQKKSSKVDLLKKVFNCVGALGGILKFIDKICDWAQKHFPDIF